MISIDYLINTQELVECRFKVDTLKECDDISDILCIVVNHYHTDKTWFGSEIKELIELNKINIIKITRESGNVNSPQGVIIIENSIVSNKKSLSVDIDSE